MMRLTLQPPCKASPNMGVCAEGRSGGCSPDTACPLRLLHHAGGAAEKRNGTKPVLAASPGAVITHFDRSSFRGRGFILVHSAGYRLPWGNQGVRSLTRLVTPRPVRRQRTMKHASAQLSLSVLHSPESADQGMAPPTLRGATPCNHIRFIWCCRSNQGLLHARHFPDRATFQSWGFGSF